MIAMEGRCTFAELVQYGLALRLQSAQSVIVISICVQRYLPGRVQYGLAPRLAPIAVDCLDSMRRVRA